MRLLALLRTLPAPAVQVSPANPEAQAVELVAAKLETSLSRSCGPSVAVRPRLLTSFLSELGLDNCEPLLSKLPRGMVYGASGLVDPHEYSLRRYVSTVAKQVKDLKLLSKMLLETNNVRGMALMVPDDDEDIASIVHYSFFIHLITRAMVEDVDLLETVVQRLAAAMRSSSSWWRHLTLFEHAKMLTVELTMRKYIAARRTASVPQNFGHVGLPVNILEAVIEDLRFGRMDNAYAGLALTRARPAQLGEGASVSSDSRRAVKMNLPVASSWRELYISWNSKSGSSRARTHSATWIRSQLRVHWRSGIHRELRRLAFLCSCHVEPDCPRRRDVRGEQHACALCMHRVLLASRHDPIWTSLAVLDEQGSYASPPVFI